MSWRRRALRGRAPGLVYTRMILRLLLLLSVRCWRADAEWSYGSGMDGVHAAGHQRLRGKCSRGIKEVWWRDQTYTVVRLTSESKFRCHDITADPAPDVDPFKMVVDGIWLNAEVCGEVTGKDEVLTASSQHFRGGNTREGSACARFWSPHGSGDRHASGPG